MLGSGIIFENGFCLLTLMLLYLQIILFPNSLNLLEQ